MPVTTATMGCKLNRRLLHYAIFLIFLEVQWSPVLSAPICPSVACDYLKTTDDFAKLFELKATQLLNLSIERYGKRNETIRPEVPDTEISGYSTCEKLQNVYTKNELFKSHISQAKKYHEKLLKFPHKNPIFKKSQAVEQDLENLNIKITPMLKPFDFTPPPPPPEFTDYYNQKVYVWSVAVRLREWSKQVLMVLNQTLCD